MEGLSNLINLRIPSVEKKNLRVEIAGLCLDTELLSIVLLPVTPRVILLIEGQSFLKMDRW